MNTYTSVAILLVAITVIPNANATINRTQLIELFKEYAEAWFRTLEAENGGKEWTTNWDEIQKIKTQLAGVDYMFGYAKTDGLGSSDLIVMYKKRDSEIIEKGIAQDYKLHSVRQVVSKNAITNFVHTQGKAKFAKTYDIDTFSCVCMPFSGPTFAANGKDVDKSAPPCNYIFFIMGIADS